MKCAVLLLRLSCIHANIFPMARFPFMIEVVQSHREHAIHFIAQIFSTKFKMYFLVQLKALFHS
jgi:hypothetical protein